MKIKYESVTGEVTEIDVEDEIGTVILDSRRREKADDEYQRRHCPYHLGALDYEGEEYASPDSPEDRMDASDKQESIDRAFACLTEIQKRRILLLAEGKSLREISRLEGTDIKTVRESVKAARKKFIKNFR